MAFRLGLASAILLIAIAALAAFSTPASAGWGQSNCPLRYIEVDDDYPATSLANCQFKTILEVELLPLTSGDIVKIYNGTYQANWTISANGISLVGESQKGVIVYGLLVNAPFALRGSDINISSMTLVGTNYGMDAQTGARAALVDLRLQGNNSFGCLCLQSGLNVRGVNITNSQDGFYSLGTGISIDGLQVNTSSATTTWKLILGGPGARVANVSLYGSSASRAALYYFLSAGNSTLKNVFIENATYGVWWAVYDTLTTFRNFTIHNVTTAFYSTTGGTVVFDGLNVTDTGTGLGPQSGASMLMYLNGGAFRNVSLPVQWTYGQHLTITNSTFADTPNDGIYFALGGTWLLTLVNTSLSNISGGYAVHTNGLLNWTGGTVNGSVEGLFIDSLGSAHVQGVTFSNLSDSAVILYGGVGNVFDGCTFYRVQYGMSLWSYQYGPVFANNRFEDVAYTGISITGEFYQISNNTFVNTSRPINWYIDNLDGPSTWQNITSDNTADGKPVYFVSNTTNVSVPSTAALVFIFNSSNILVSGINESTYNAVAIQASRSANITVRDVWVTADTPLRFVGTKGIVISNATGIAQNLNQGLYLDTVRDVNVSGLDVYGQIGGGYGFYLAASNNVTLDTFIGHNIGQGAYIYNSQFVNLSNIGMPSILWNAFSVDGSSFVRVTRSLAIGGGYFTQSSNNVSYFDILSLNSTSQGFYNYYSQYVLYSNVTAMNPAAEGLYLDSSDNVTVRNGSFAAGSPRGAYLISSPNYRTYNSTYVSLSTTSFYVDTGCYAITVVHNNFYGGAVSNTNGYGTWDGGYPAAGNYYAYAAGGFVDEKTGPGQNVLVGHDGIKDAPVYPIGGGKNDNYALMDPWPPAVALTSPPDRSLVRAGTVLNFSVSNFFDTVSFFDDKTTVTGALTYPHDINTTGWADGWHNITITAKDNTILDATLAVPTVVRTFSFEFDSTAPVFSSVPALGFPALQAGVVIRANVSDPHLFAWRYTVDGTPFLNTTLPWAIDTGFLGLGPGNHTIVFFANDSLNNSATYTWKFYIDGSAPSLMRTSPILNYTLPGTQVTYTASDDFNLTRVVYAASEVGGGWSYTGNLTNISGSWIVDTTAFADGHYTLNVSAYDEAGHVTVVSWDFWVDSSAPDLSAFVEFFVNEDVPYTFAGNLIAELDPLPNIQWNFDPARWLALVTLTGSSPSYTFDTPGGYNINLVVTDRAGNANSVNFTLWVEDTTNPVPAFSVNATVNEDARITLDASGSTDNDAYWDGGTNGTFDWNIDGPGGPWSLSGMVTDFTPAEPGAYNITLSVYDRTGNMATLEHTLRALDVTPPAISVTGGPGPFNEGDTVTLNASGSTDNVPGALVFEWRFTYGTPQVIRSAQFSFQFIAPGTYSLTLHVFDTTGNEALLTIPLRVNDVPAITGTPITTIHAGDNYEWAPTLVDSDTGDTWTWTLLSGPNAMSIGSAGVIVWPTTTGSYGVYNISFRVSDGLSHTDSSFVLTVTRVANPANRAPFFNSFPVQNGTPGQSYTYAALVSDPDTGDQLTVALGAAPDGMTVDSAHTVHWQIPPGTADGTVFNVKLELSDGLIQVWQNYTIRLRAADLPPLFASGKVPASLSVDEGKEVTLVMDSNFAADPDDNFPDLFFFATSGDGQVLGVSVTHDGPVWTLHLKGLKAGTTTVTLRVTDPSGQGEQKTIQTSVVAPASPSVASSPLLLLILLLAALGAGVVGIVVMRRRKKDDEAVPIAAAPAAPLAPARPSALAAEEVQVEVVQVPVPAAKPSLPPAAAAVALGAGVAAAAAAARPAPPIIEPVKPAKAATFVIEGLFVIYQDGRMIYSKTDIGQQQLGDPELVSSMFTAVTQFIKDSFSAEGELNKMGYGENQIVIERGNNFYAAVITFGEPDKELQEKLQTAIEKIEYAYAGIIEAWDGQQNRFADISQYLAPVLALTSGITRQDVLAATTTKDVKVLSQLEFFQGFVRLKVGVKNDTEAVVTKVTLDIDYNEDVLRLQRIEPASYKTSGARVMLNVLNPGEKSSVAFYFDPQICTETNIDGIVRFRDYKGVLQSVTMKTRKAEVVCPLFFTKEHANTAMLKRLIENELQEKDSKVYTITKLPPYVKHKDIFDVCKSVVLSHDVHMVREFVSYNPFSGEAWFYGETKVKGYKIVIRAAVREDNTIEFFAASSTIKAVTGLLAEFNHTLVSMIAERYADVKIEQVYDEAKKHEIQAKSLVDRLGEGEAGAGETEQQK